MAKQKKLDENVLGTGAIDQGTVKRIEDELDKTCGNEAIIKITELVGLGEAQRRIYESLIMTEKLKTIYKLHQKELSLLIKYQAEVVILSDKRENGK